MSFLRAATPLFESLSSSVRAATSLGSRKVNDGAPLRQVFPPRSGGMRKRAKRLASGVFSRKGVKRERSSPAPDDKVGMAVEEEGEEPVRLNFLFVGAKRSGQTSLLL